MALVGNRGVKVETNKTVTVGSDCVQSQRASDGRQAKAK